MKIYGANGENKTLLDNLLMLNINIEESVPADNFTATFKGEILEEYEMFLIFINDVLFLKALIDETTISYSDTFTFTKITGRSMAAVLLDNEVLPQSYNCPNAKTIFTRHCLPFNINEFECDISPINAQIQVSKGQSHFDVISNFSKFCLGTTAEVSSSGTLLFCGYKAYKTVNFGSDVPISEVSISKKRYKLLSNVFVKTTFNDDYNLNLENKITTEKNIVRHRFINATALTSYNIDTARKMLKNSTKEYFNITLKTPMFLGDVIGENANLKYKNLYFKDLYVSKIIYNFNKGEEYTIITLKNKI